MTSSSSSSSPFRTVGKLYHQAKIESQSQSQSKSQSQSQSSNLLSKFWGGRLGPLGPGPPRILATSCLIGFGFGLGLGLSLTEIDKKLSFESVTNDAYSNASPISPGQYSLERELNRPWRYRAVFFFPRRWRNPLTANLKKIPSIFNEYLMKTGR